MRRTFLSCILVCFVGAYAGAGEAGDPRIKGKPLSKLLVQIRDTNRGLQVRAARALGEAPEELRPRIIEALQPVLRSERENDRFVAAQVLGEYGPPARAVVPDLVPMLEGTQFERNRAAAATALGRILKDAEPSEEITRVTEKLVSVFGDPYPDVRREAVKACGMIGPGAKGCLPHLVKPLEANRRGGSQDVPYAMVRSATAWTLGRMGPLSKEYIDRLIAIMHIDTMGAAVTAMGAIGPVHENVVPNIVDKMEKVGRNGAGFRLAAMKTLETFGPASAMSVPFLVRVMREELGSRGPVDQLVAACRVMGAIGMPAAEEAIPLLKKASTHTFHPHSGISKEDHKLVHDTAKAALAILEKKTGTEEQNE